MIRGKYKITHVHFYNLCAFLQNPKEQRLLIENNLSEDRMAEYLSNQLGFEIRPSTIRKACKTIDFKLRVPRPKIGLPKAISNTTFVMAHSLLKIYDHLQIPPPIELTQITKAPVRTGSKPENQAMSIPPQFPSDQFTEASSHV